VGDRITAIADEPIATRALAQWRALPCDWPAGTKLALRFVRAGKEQATELTLADRIRPDAT
jgi:S1-C subfamily serine protease